MSDVGRGCNTLFEPSNVTLSHEVGAGDGSDSPNQVESNGCPSLPHGVHGIQHLDQSLARKLRSAEGEDQATVPQVCSLLHGPKEGPLSRLKHGDLRLDLSSVSRKALAQ